MRLLFRTEALEAQRQQWLGRVQLVRPLSLTLFTVAALALLVLVGCFLTFAHYTRKAAVPGVLVPDRGLIRLAPSLAGSGNRWSEGQLRLRLVDASSLNPATIMPSYYRIDGLTRVGAAWRGKSILSAEQIEDMVAYLVTLRQ